MDNWNIFTSDYAPGMQTNFKEILYGKSSAIGDRESSEEKMPILLEKASKLLDNLPPALNPRDKVEKLLMEKEGYQHLAYLVLEDIKDRKEVEDNTFSLEQKLEKYDSQIHDLEEQVKEYEKQEEKYEPEELDHSLSKL